MKTMKHEHDNDNILKRVKMCNGVDFPANVLLFEGIQHKGLIRHSCCSFYLIYV